MYIAFSILLFIFFCIWLFLQHPKFGKLPKGERLEKIKNSPNYRNGSFQNLSLTPDLTEGATYFSVGKEYFFGPSKRVRPIDKIPSFKTDLQGLDTGKDILVWFGHSSYFIQLDKKRFLVDPVFSGSASPVSFSTKSFKGTDIYTPSDMPDIDYLLITHDHWDHLDYDSIKKLRPRIGRVICGLGTGQHLERWGYSNEQIMERDWHEHLVLPDGFFINTIPARHFSGRGLKRNQALWTSFVLQTPTMKIFIGGDSGYDTHFAEAGKEFGVFDLVILEDGQYDKSWKYIHMMPGEVLQAAKDLNAKSLLAIHNSKFAIANHPWDEPLKKISKECRLDGMALLTPRIGEAIYLKDKSQKFAEWWTDLR